MLVIIVLKLRLAMLRQKVESISTCYFLCVVYIMGKNGGWVDGRALGFNEVMPKCG